jgi:hypothetical protein
MMAAAGAAYARKPPAGHEGMPVVEHPVTREDLGHAETALGRGPPSPSSFLVRAPLRRDDCGGLGAGGNAWMPAQRAAGPA